MKKYTTMQVKIDAFGNVEFSKTDTEQYADTYTKKYSNASNASIDRIRKYFDDGQMGHDCELINGEEYIVFESADGQTVLYDAA